MKKNKMKVIRFFLFIAILVASFNSYADTFEEEKKFILSVKLPLIPEASIMQISTKLSNTNNEIYKLNFNIKTLNLIDYISSVNGNGYTEGSIKNNFYIPEYYKYDYVRKSKNKSVSIKYLNGKIIDEIFTPEFDKEKLTPIKNEQKNDTVDPATLFLKLLDLNKTSKCKDTVKVYDGKRRYDIIFDEKTINDHVIECTAWQNRIGGYKKDKIDPLTNTDLLKIRYENSPDNKFLEFFAKKGIIEFSIKEINYK